MYKTRVKQWGLDKKHKENEMRAIVHKHAHRIESGKASTFRTRGKKVDYQDVVRYWEKRRIPISEVIAQRAASKTPEGMECFTPIPSPVRTPESLAMPENMFLTIRNYHSGSFESGTWTAEEASGCCQTTKGLFDASMWIDTLRRQCELACYLFDHRCAKEAGAILEKATTWIKAIILAEHPHAFAQFLEMVVNIRWRGKQEIAVQILRQVSAMGAILLGDSHPFKVVYGWLASLDSADYASYQDILGRALQVVCEFFEASLGYLHRTSIETRLIHTVIAYDKGSDAAQESLEGLLQICNLFLGPDDTRTHAVDLQLAFNYHMQHSFTTAWPPAIKMAAADKWKQCESSSTRTLE